MLKLISEVIEIFCIIFESIFFNKTVSEGRSEADVIIMLKMLVLHLGMVFPTLNFGNRVLIEFLSGNFLVLLGTSRQHHSLIIQNKDY